MAQKQMGVKISFPLKRNRYSPGWEHEEYEARLRHVVIPEETVLEKKADGTTKEKSVKLSLTYFSITKTMSGRKK